MVVTRLSIHVLSGGERVPMLHDKQGLPLFYPTLFATTQLRNAGAAVNTIRNKLADISVLLRWEEQHGRDLIAEFTQGSFLTVADVVSLRDFAKLDMRSQLPASNEVGTSHAAAVYFLESRVASSHAQAAVGGQQHYNRISTLADYLEFVATVRIGRPLYVCWGGGFSSKPIPASRCSATQCHHFWIAATHRHASRRTFEPAPRSA